MQRTLPPRRAAARRISAVVLLAACGSESTPPPDPVLWLRADTAVRTEERSGVGFAVAEWRDVSGHQNHAAPVPYPPGVPATDPAPDRRPAWRSGAHGLNGRPLVDFDGRDDLLGIADSEELNLGGPYTGRTILLVFRTGEDVERRQMLFEAGGDLRGFNLYLDGGRLYLGAFNVWNDDRGATTPFGPASVTAPVRPGAAYAATMLFDQPRGRLVGFLDGREVGTATGVGRVFLHHEDIGIGAINEDTYYHDGVRQGVPTGDFFEGELAELLIYNRALGERERRAAEEYLLRRYALGSGAGAREGGDPGGTAAASSFVRTAEDGRERSEEEADAGPGRLYVTSGLTDEVLRLDARDGRIAARFALDRRRGELDEPHGVAVSPAGDHWYATLSHGDPTLWKFELPGDRLVGRVSLGTAGAARIGITPDGRRAFIPDYQRAVPTAPGRVAVVELADLSVTAAPIVCAGPHDAAVDPAGRRVAVACSLADEVVLLDASSLEQMGRFPVDPESGPAGSPRFRPLNLLWSPDGEALYVALHEAAAVRAFDGRGRIIGTAHVGAGPAQIALTPDGRTLAVANRRERSVSVVSVSKMQERARVPIDADHPHGVVLDSAGRTAFVACEGTVDGEARVVAVDLTEGRVLWSVPAGSYALGIAYAEGS
ncbi:MAG: beta-propeller fold lactonase family protein [Gemmatimonadota bacterium]